MSRIEVIDEMKCTWTRVGGIAGILTVFGYLVVLYAPGPLAMTRLVFFSLPLGGILFVLGLWQLMKLHRNTITLQVATLFGIIGFAVMNVMAVVQNSIDTLTSRGVPTARDAATREMVDWVRRSVNAVQLGMDVSFDMFLLLSLVLYGIAMLNHPRFGRKFGIPGCVAATATLALNLYAFPLPPEPDLGPLVALWLFAVAVRMLFSADHAERVRSEPVGGE